MRKRNKIFAEAFKWIKAHRDNEGKGVKYQKDLAALVGVSEDTITRIMHDQTEVTDDFLCKFNEAFDNVFNYQWLRGEDNEPMLTADLDKSNPQQSAQASAQVIDPSSMVNAIIATYEGALATKNELINAKEENIEGLKRELRDKDKLINANEETITSLKQQLRDKDELIISLRQQLLQLQQLQRQQSHLSPYPYPTGVADDKKV
jgi:plasmid maintenance system antidote protein VapI